MNQRRSFCQPSWTGHRQAWPRRGAALFRIGFMALALAIAPRVALAQGLRLPPSWWLLGSWDAEIPAPGVLPSRFVWTELFPGKEARDQGSVCGSCWAFGAVGALEFQVMIYERRDVHLSEQWLINCNQDGQGCDGGFVAYPYLMRGSYADNCGGNGAVLENDLPYTGRPGTCNCPYTHHYWLAGWRFIGFPLQLQAERRQIQRAIYLFGPISASVNMRPWPQNRFTEVLNTCTGDLVNHVVLIVGWNDALGAWRIRNSWGSDWGDNGEAWVAYECNAIGFAANYVTYPTGHGVYVDFNYTGLAGNETGLFNQPFDTLDEGVRALDSGGTLSVKAGSSSATPLWTKAMTVKSFGGPVTIGR